MKTLASDKPLPAAHQLSPHAHSTLDDQSSAHLVQHEAAALQGQQDARLAPRHQRLGLNVRPAPLDVAVHVCEGRGSSGGAAQSRDGSPTSTACLTRPAPQAAALHVCAMLAPAASQPAPVDTVLLTGSDAA